MTKTLRFSFAAALVLAYALPAAAATRHHPVQRMPVAAEQDYNVNAGYAGDANPFTAGSNCGDLDCGVYYNRLGTY